MNPMRVRLRAAASSRCGGLLRSLSSPACRSSCLRWGGSGRFPSILGAVTTTPCAASLPRIEPRRWQATSFFTSRWGLSLPAGAYLTIIGGILFGTLFGGLAAIIGASIGAIVIFCIARSALGEQLVRKAGSAAAKAAQGFRENAFSYLLFLRLVPIFPFWLVNLVSAVCGLRLTTFAAGTVLGIMPATFVFASVGSGLASVVTAQEHSYKACLAAGRADCRLTFRATDALHAAPLRGPPCARPAGARSRAGETLADGIWSKRATNDCDSSQYRSAAPKARVGVNAERRFFPWIALR